LYQNALKLHSQGPAFYGEADAAYDALFASEIFGYPEAFTDSKRAEHYGNALEDRGEAENEVHAAPATMPVKPTDGIPNTLPQLLYLSYKNHGQFLLDQLTHRLVLSGSLGGSSKVAPINYDRHSLATALDSLDFFAEALERDETDSDLWRRASRIGSLIGSRRIARYCLEAVFHTRGIDFRAGAEPVSLEETLAGGDLKELVAKLQDELSEIGLVKLLQKVKRIPSALRRVMDACPELPTASHHLDLNSLPASQTLMVPLAARNWASVGKAILLEKAMELQGTIEPGFGARYTIMITTGEAPYVGPTSNSRQSVYKTSANQNSKTTELIVLDLPPESPGHYARNKALGELAVVATSKHADMNDTPDDDGRRAGGNQHAHVENGEERNGDDIRDRADTEDGTVGNPEPAAAAPLESASVNLPTRKRNSESAGLQDAGESGRVRSKRIRARAEVAPDEENDALELARYYEDRLQEYVQADLWLNEVTNAMLSKLGIQGFNLSGEADQALPESEPKDQANTPCLATSHRTALQDFKDALRNWNSNSCGLFLQRSAFDETVAKVNGGDDSSFGMFLEYARAGSLKASSRPVLSGDNGLLDFISLVNQSWTSMNDLVMHYVGELLQRRYDRQKGSEGSRGCTGSKFLDYMWPDALKDTLVEILVTQDEAIFTTLRHRLDQLDQRILERAAQPEPYRSQAEDLDLIELIQTIFELHVDIYSRITNPSRKVDENLIMAQQDRLKRWASVASRAISKWPFSTADSDIPDPLSLRHLWSSVIYVNLVNIVSQEHVLLCLEDLRMTLKNAGSPVLELQNNAVMPEISVEAADREIAKLTTMDFFSSIFDPTNQDPLVVIESLEPLLMGTSSAGSIRHGSDDEHPEVILAEHEMEGSGEKSSDHPMQQMADFLDKAGTSLRLFLWRRLRTAYEAIDYPPMVFMCSLKSLSLIVQELQSPSYTSEPCENRTAQLIRWLGNLDDLLIKSLRLAMEHPSAFDCMDDTNLSLAVKVCAVMTRLLHVFVTWEDSIRVGQSMLPSQPNGPPALSMKLALNQLREMHLKAWMLQYLVLKESLTQNVTYFPAPAADLAEYLRTLHNALGLRGYCKLAEKRFLKFAKAELLGFRATSDFESEMAQIIFDLYGLKICPNNTGPADHGCPPENIDRPAAFELVDFVMGQAQRINIKDLLKTELKGTIDKMQGVLGAPIPKTLQFNRRLLNIYLKAPINPLDIYRSLRGIGSISGTSIRTEHAPIAAKGWYFLLGYMTFTKFRSQKRVSPTPTDDLDISIIFFWHDLEFDMENWETWYRLAQVYDAKLEEDTTWNSDKLNGHMEELVVLQRNAIRCYMMAVAVAVRCADDSFETAAKISELYTDFGNRVYSSSREPFSMAAFDLKDYKRFCNNIRGTYERTPFRQLHLREAWNLAAVLFRQALVDKPGTWSNWYMLGKCLWKMYTSGYSTGQDAPPGPQEALEAFTMAIQCVPEKKDNRHPDRDPVLEPHYKLVSVVHKLVQGKVITPEEGCRHLDATSYAAKVPHVEDPDAWEAYIISVLNKLRAADKANWHHRMVARAAHVIYDDSPSDVHAILGAKHELTQQIFTKTMSIQVWKPEHERPGRHFVYTSRYVRFLIKLLMQLGDRASIEALGRRVRKKPGDFVDHASIWVEVCNAHLKLLRFQGGIPEAHEDTIFKMVFLDTFTVNSNRLEAWAHSLPPSATPSHPAKLVDLLREMIELKKTNGTLMKSTLIDDLIGDIFARIYEEVVPELIAKSNDEENRDRMRVNHLLMNSDAPSADSPSAAASPFGSGPGQGLDQPATRMRPKTVGRRDIGRRAEALVVKSVAPPPAPKPKTPASGPTPAPAGGGGLAVVIERPVNLVDDLAVKDTSSAAGSVHDSADDESELSDIAEEEEEKVEKEVMEKSLFPGVAGRGGRDEGDGADTVDDDKTEDDVNEEMGEEEKLEDVREEGERGGTA